MAIESCPNPLEACPWFTRKTPDALRGQQEHGCHSNQDHIVPRRLAQTALASVYIFNHPENTQQLCAWEHDKKTADGDEPLPTEDYMKQAIIESIISGEMTLSKNKRKKLGLSQRDLN